MSLEGYDTMLNLKYFNETVNEIHFITVKMNHLKTIKYLKKPDVMKI